MRPQLDEQGNEQGNKQENEQGNEQKEIINQTTFHSTYLKKNYELR
jgi:hypothetical protein